MAKKHAEGNNDFCCHPDLASLLNIQILDIAINRSYGCALCENGKVYEWGDGNCNERQNSQIGNNRFPQQIHQLNGYKIQSIACGNSHVVASIRSCKGVITWGGGFNRANRPAELSNKQRQILGIGNCSHQNCCHCNEKMELNTSNENKQLKSISNNMFWVIGLEKKEVVSVSAGDNFSMVLVKDNNEINNINHIDTRKLKKNMILYSWGIGECGQLGLGVSKQISCIAKRINFQSTMIENDEREQAEELDVCESYPVDVSCGPSHVAVVDNIGRLYTFGAGSRCQLGHGIAQDEWSPKLVKTLLGVGSLRPNGSSAGIKVHRDDEVCPGLSFIACGLWHTLAISVGGDLYSWGWGRFGQLGYTKQDSHISQFDKEHSNKKIKLTNDTENVSFSSQGEEKEEEEEDMLQSIPRLVSSIEDEVVAVACGSRHSVVLTSPDNTEGSWNNVRFDLKVFGILDPASLSSLSPPPSSPSSSLSNPKVLKSGPWHFVWC